MEPNPAAIAWYVEEAQRLLEDQQRRAELLRTRGGQIAGFEAAVLALLGSNTGTVLGAVEGLGRVVLGGTLLAAVACLVAAVMAAVWGVIKPRPYASVAVDEITMYASDRFLTEPDLWRVHVRSLRTLEEATRETQEDGNAAAGAIMVSLYFFLASLCFSLVSLGTLVLGLI